MGSCYTYNPGVAPRHRVTQAGSTYGMAEKIPSNTRLKIYLFILGLRMILAGSQAEYCCSAIKAGYKIVIHENNLQPFPDAEGYTIPYGVSTAFGLYQVDTFKTLSTNLHAETIFCCSEAYLD